MSELAAEVVVMVAVVEVEVEAGMCVLSPPKVKDKVEVEASLHTIMCRAHRQSWTDVKGVSRSAQLHR